jgi:hypothetical protein
MLHDIPHKSKAIPVIPMGHPQYVYVPAANTDVQRTWRKYGWTPTNNNQEEKK